MVKTLTVYKASAGSGKTFTLATQYIKLLVENPTNYRHILAVTFTNKATEEMKMRILSQLYGVWKGLPDSESYLQRIMADTGFDAQTVSRRAGEALHLLLHNYNYFRVETIDSFFQSVLRNLARELDLTANLRIGLNDTQVEEQAVDQLIDSLTHTDVMLQWLLSYIMEKISDDRSWNIIGQVKQFGKTIFRDYYKEHSQSLKEKIGTAGFIEAYSEQLRQIRKDARERMQEIAETFFDALDGERLTVDDLNYGKTGVASFFLKLRNGQMDEGSVGKRALDCMGDPTKWYGKKSEHAEQIHMLAETTLMPILRYAIDERPRQYRLYQSADLTLRHLSQLRLLDSIEQKVRQLNDESNRFLLSDTQQLLHALISDSDSPFIFEKIGTQLEYIMIDEFQDTSTVQWQNFKLLLQECMSHQQSENLIVGDVKQSIYRWRSGDWRLLNAIDREFANAEEMVTVKPLETNYRSERNIILFNNAFFTEAARQEYERLSEENPSGADQLRHAYADVEQQVPAKRKSAGRVSIELLPADGYREATFERLADEIGSLLACGAAPGDIAILVRSNKLIPQIADYMAAHLPDVRIVSDEAFRLDASVSVCLLIQAMHLLTHPDDLLAKATLAKLYHRSVLGDTRAEEDLLIRDQPLDDLLPAAFTGQTTELLQLPLYELAERLYAIFDLQRLNDQSAYLCAFYDQLNQFTQDYSTDIDAFVREWESTISGKTIQSDESGGVRILTIHKSKGLEFRHVLIPFCDWRLEMPDILWCEPHEAPFDALPIAPIDYSEKQMVGTIYEHDYKDEHLQNTVDNLNLLYVAFTRARNNLFVIGRRDSSNSRSRLVQDVLAKWDVGEELQSLPINYEYGQLLKKDAKHEEDTQNKFLIPEQAFVVGVESHKNAVTFRQSNQSLDFVHPEEESSDQSRYIKMGNVLHNLFSTISTTADIPRALRRLESEGILYDEDVSAEKLSAMLARRFENPQVASWFAPGWTLFNECSIISVTPEGEVRKLRPDRVMTDGRQMIVVDFKFGRRNQEYHDQVKQYMDLLCQMGHTNVKGYLWYVYNNQIEEVR